MKKILLTIFMGCLFSAQSFSEEAVKISLSHFPPFTNKSRKDFGNYPRYLKSFFTKKDLNVEFYFMPYARSLQNFKKGITDFIILGESSIPKDLLKTNSFYKVRICLFHNIDKNPNLVYQKPEDLKKYKVVSIKDSPQNKILLDAGVKLVNVSTFESAFKMIKYGRADVFPNSYQIGEFYKKNSKTKFENIVCGQDIVQEPTVLGVSKKSKFKHLIKELNTYFATTDVVFN